MSGLAPMRDVLASFNCGLSSIKSHLPDTHMPRPKLTIIDRIRLRTDRSGGPDSCWPWLGHRDPKGYGTTEFYTDTRTRQKKTVKVTRAFAEALLKRKLRRDEIVCHTCDNPPCCNPRHWHIGDVKWNHRDMMRKGRHRAVRGEQHPRCKTSEAAVAGFKDALRKGESMTAARTRFGISRHMCYAIQKGKAWKHVP
jgi:hypothetical protein